VSYAAITLCVASQQVFIVVVDVVYFITNSVWKLLDAPLYFQHYTVSQPRRPLFEYDVQLQM
jgi:hypothetical protein